MRLIIAVSGPIAVGKSQLIRWFEDRFRAVRVSTRELIQSLKKNVPTERGALQNAGDELDRETDGKWVANGLAARMAKMADDAIVIVDSVRIARQVEQLKSRFGDRVFHVHLTASEEVLRQRFDGRNASGDPTVREFATYDEAKSNPTEAQVEGLGEIANRRIVTDRLEPASIGTLIAKELSLLGGAIQPLVDVVVGGQFGSEGKGNICDYLAQDYQVLVRVGGPNAGHRVAEPQYDYIHMPSGTGGNPNTKILIGAGAVLDVKQVLKEIQDWRLDPLRLSIDPQAMIIEPSDCELETGIKSAIGSTGKGVGAATARKIVGRGDEDHLGAKVRLARDIRDLKPYLRSVTAELENAYSAGLHILLEGTQGTDLSIHHGGYPKVTSRKTTVSGCLADAGISPRRVNRIYMVTRTYPIRVGGDSGHMGIEISVETVADRCGLPVEEIRKTEVGTVSGKPRRIAEFSWDQVHRASQLNGATDIVLTFADYIDAKNRDARSFDDLTERTKAMVGKIEALTGAPVSLIAAGSGRKKIIDRRTNR